MGRKFSFNLAPLKAPSKPDKQAEPSPTALSPRRRPQSRDSVTSVNMSYISRQRIDPQTERELRAACALILQNFKPSDHDMPDADPKLDFQGPHRRREYNTEPSQVKVHRPTGAPPEYRSSHDAPKQTYKLDNASKGYPDLPMRAYTGRRRVENTENTDAEVQGRRHVKSSATDASRQFLPRPDTDTDDVLSVGTPLTASTDAHVWNGSTAPTSVAVTHRSSKRTSRQPGDPGAIADAQAAEWMRQELEKRRQQMGAQPQYRPQTSERPHSRATSIRSGIREYIFPGSTNLSRTQSRDSSSSHSSSQPRRSGSVKGWRSYGLNRMSSSRNSSRPGTSSARAERSEHDKKNELNLNRELPPLPSLDTWKEPERPEDKAKAAPPGAHIATLMRTQDEQPHSYAAAARQHHRRSGSDSLTTRYANAYGPAPRMISPTHQAFAHKNVALVPENRPSDFDHVVSAMLSTRNLDDQLKLGADGHTIQRNGGTTARKSSDDRVTAPNFSRKISTDPPLSERPLDPNEVAYPNVVHITATPPQKSHEQKSRLKKVLSTWMIKKEKKNDDWMHKFEKEGIRAGVMMQNEAALPPVVRY